LKKRQRESAQALGERIELPDEAGIFRDLLEAAPDALLITDGDGRIVFANSQTEALFGYTRDELLGQLVELLVPERLRRDHTRHRERFAAEPRKRPMGSGYELVAVRKDGSEFPVEISLSPHSVPSGTLYSAAIRDITTRVAVERELRRARAQAEQASNAKSRFLAAASHDLRQPLQAAILYNNVLTRQLAGTLHAATASKLESSLHALRDLLNRLLDISRLEAGALTPEIAVVSLPILFEHLRDQFLPQAQQKHLRLRLRPGPWKVRSDPQLLEQLLRNLVTNAIRYTEKGGVLVGCRRRGNQLRIQVWDSGIGIPANELDAVFDEFYRIAGADRGRQAGMGLGLAIVRGLSQLLGHPVTVRSKVGRGTVFEVRVPLADAEIASATEPVSRTKRGQRAVIVVVDDDLEVLDGLRLSLEQFGHDVIASPDADSALRLAGRLERAPDLIISDYRLGDSITGAEVIRRLRAELRSDIPAIVVTGDSSTAALSEVRGAGFPVLHKPVDPNELELLIARSLPNAARETGI
jgi:PAS domain S-box-containing protein